jgi:transposase
MAVKAMTVVGLDVHARQTHAAIVDPVTGEVRVSKLRMAPIEVASFLEGLGPDVVAVYEAGPTGFGLARAARERGVDVRVAAPGSIPKGPGDRVKTDRRDAIRLVRLLAAGELSFAFVPSVADEQFRDLVRVIEDVRGDLMRSRHRLGKFLLRRGERYPRPGGAWTGKHLAWLRGLSFDDACSRATFADYLAAVELLLGRRASLLAALERQIPESSHAAVIARLRCFRGIDTLSAAGLCAEVGQFARFPRPTLLSGFLGIARPSGRLTPSAARARSPRPGRRTPAGYSSRPRSPTATGRRSANRSRAASTAKTRASSRSPGAPSGACTNAGSTCTTTAASPRTSSRSPARANSPRSSGRPPRLTDPTPTTAPGTLPGRARAHRRPTTVARGSRDLLWATGQRRPRPSLDSEPRRIPGLEVAPSNISLTPPSTALDLPLVPPRQRPGHANHAVIRRRRPTPPTSPYQ